MSSVRELVRDPEGTPGPPDDPAAEDLWHPPSRSRRSRADARTMSVAARRSRWRAARVVIGAFLGYAAMSLVVPGVVAQRVFGSTVTVGLLCGLTQIVVVVAVIARYVKDMREGVDPLAAAIRRESRGRQQ